MSKETSDQPKSIKLSSPVKVPGVISPWHHSGIIPVLLRAGLQGSQLPDGTYEIACLDGRHTVTTKALPPGAFTPA